MARSTLEKISKNVDISKNSKPKTGIGGGNYKGKDNFSYVIPVTNKDIPRLNAAISQELALFNKIICGLKPMLRNNHEFIASIKGEYFDLFGEIAYSLFNVQNILNRTDIELPKNLKRFERILLGKDNNKNRYLTDLLIQFYKLPCGSPGVLPLTRKNMALSLLEHYKQQAHIMRGGSNSSVNEYNVYLDILEEPDDLRKRHVQIFKDDVKWTWDANNEETILKIPYLSKKIRIPVNLNEFLKWNVVLIHQEPGDIPSTDTPWVIEFKTSNGYLYKYMDVSNPYKGVYHSAKPKNLK